MNVSELGDLTYWITDEVVTRQVPEKYKALYAILKQHAQPNQAKAQFETQKDDLITTIRKVPLHQLTKDQLAFLQELGIRQAVGEEGIREIENILFRNVIDVATSAQALGEIHQQLSIGVSKSDQIKAGLEGCFTREEFEVDDNVLLRVSFTGGATMENVSDFKRWGSIWFDIGRGIAMAHNESPESVRVVRATTGSIVIELAVVYGIAKTASQIVLEALKVAERVLAIRTKVEELRSLKLANKKLATDLEKEATKEKEAGVTKISTAVVRELRLSANNDGEKVAVLEKAVKNLVSFVESGGEVDFVVPDNAAEEDAEAERSGPDYSALRSATEEIHRLECQLKLLGPGTTPDDD